MRVHLFIILVVLTCLFCARDLFYTRQIEVSFDTRINKACDFGVFFHEEENGKFSGENFVSKRIHPDPAKDFVRVSLTLPVERLSRFRLDFGSEPGEVLITNLAIKGDVVVHMNDFSKFECSPHVVKKIISPNSLLIESWQRDPFIIYRQKLCIGGEGCVDWKMLLILATVFSFLSYKLVSYLLAFNINEKYSRIDIVFLGCFFAALVMPMLQINKDDRSSSENRMLAKYASFWKENSINKDYGKSFEDWFNDRFWGREVLITIHTYLREIGNRYISTPKGLKGEDDWLFTKDYNSVNMYRNANLFKQCELERIGENLETFVSNAKALGMEQVYFLINNDKETLYSEFYPKYIIRKPGMSRLEQLLSYLHERHQSLKVLNFYAEFQDLKRQGVVLYSKAGSHKNPIGAFYEYKYLMDAIRVDFPLLPSFQLSDFVISEAPEKEVEILNGMHLICYNNENLKSWALQLKSPLCAKAHTLRGTKVSTCRKYTNGHCRGGTGLNAIVIGDSFFNRYINYFSESFNQVIHCFYGYGGGFDLTEADVRDFAALHAKIMVVETTERFLQRFLTLRLPRVDKMGK